MVRHHHLAHAILGLIWLAWTTGCPTPLPDLGDAQRDYSGTVRVTPNIEGFGANTPAGRGGRIMVVDSLEASGAGTLREALEAEGKRTVVFAVGGVIDLRRNIVIDDPYVTVAGQTAPSPGINLIGAGISIRTHDVLVQHLRVRPGDRSDGVHPEKRDAIDVIGAKSGERDVYGVVVDHCSMSWATDEVGSTWYPGVRDVTWSNNIFAEGLWDSIHPESPHSKGLLIGDHSRRVTAVRNLFAHNNDRNPVVGLDASAYVANNLIYNPGHFAIVVYKGKHCCPSLATIVGNRMISGADTWEETTTVRVTNKSHRDTRLYVEDNGSRRSHYGSETWVESPPVRVEPMEVLAAEEVEEHVLKHAGARPWDRDAIDRRVVRDVEQRTGEGPDSVEEAGGFPDYPSTHRQPQIPDEPHADPDGDGYTNLEEWLHDQSAGRASGGG